MLLATSCILGLLTSLLSAKAAINLALEITGPSVVHGVDNLNVVATLINQGDDAVKVLNDPNSPLSRMPADTFIISGDNGGMPNFIGIKAKYSPQAAVDAGEFTDLGPNESVQIHHNLAESYDFSQAGQGVYTVIARTELYIVTLNNAAQRVDATLVRGHKAKLIGRLTRPRTSIEKVSVGSTCSTSQDARIQEAAASAQNYAAAAFSYLEAHTYATPRYSTWFGAYTADSHELVQAHFKTINSHNISSFTYDCSCTRLGTFAYVYPDDFGKIYLCGAFWKARLEGTDSRAGTLVHESSHFTRNGGTGDYAYGQDESKSLARHEPLAAIRNADSHEYFVENTPALV